MLADGLSREQIEAGIEAGELDEMYAEYLLEHGMVDAVVHRHKLRETLIRLVSLLMDPVTAEGRSLAVAGR